MKRYMLFIYDCYEPDGGMNDFVCSYDTIEQAIYALEMKDIDNTDRYHIYDLKEEKIVKEG